MRIKLFCRFAIDLSLFHLSVLLRLLSLAYISQGAMIICSNYSKVLRYYLNICLSIIRLYLEPSQLGSVELREASWAVICSNFHSTACFVSF